MIANIDQIRFAAAGELKKVPTASVAICALLMNHSGPDFHTFPVPLVERQHSQSERNFDSRGYVQDQRPMFPADMRTPRSAATCPRGVKPTYPVRSLTQTVEVAKRPMALMTL